MFPSCNAYAVIAVIDMDESRRFYEEIMKLERLDTGLDGIYYKSGNTKIYVYPSDFAGTNKATAAMWQVDDIEGCVAELKTNKVEFEHYDFPGVDRVGDVHIMGRIRAAWFKDPSGNILNITNFG
jgi:hypothetical protein